MLRRYWRLGVLLGGMLCIAITDLLIDDRVVLNPYYLAALGIFTWWYGLRWGLVLAVLSSIFTVGTALVYNSAPGTYDVINMASWFCTRIAVVLVMAQLAKSYRTNTELAQTDPLTGLANRRHFEWVYREELARAWRYHRPVSVAVLDMNGFKKFNDVHGHVAGDNVLRRLGGVLRNGLRAVDTVARVGGDEFVLLFPETTEEQAKKALTHVQSQLDDIYPDGISIGVTEYHPVPPTMELLLGKSDKEMYEQKREAAGDWWKRGC